LPIEVSTVIRACDQEEFLALDRRIMGVVFAVHNELGRLLDEDLYKCEIAARCVAMGVQPVEREVWIRVYREALVHFLGGANSVCKPVEIFSGPRSTGTQNLNMLDQDTAFAFTTKQVSANAMREHLERLLHHTRLKSIQWVNLNRHRVEFATLRPR
jgi:hypothetical protein